LLYSISIITVSEIGLVTADLRYNAWGEQRCCYGGASATPTQRRYTGQIQDFATSSMQLYFYNARYYDPALGRFTQAESSLPTRTTYITPDVCKGVYCG
jgi:RHS repeat-associated protein